MKTLFILRHAEALPDGGGGDFERVLSERGLEAAKALGEKMGGKNYAPAMALCSSAARTKQTLAGVMETVKIAKVEYSRDVYHADTEDFIDLIQGLDDKYESVIVVGHNPTVHQVIATLAADDNAFAGQLMRGYAPGTLSVLHMPRASWKDLQPGENKLADLIV